MGGLDGNVDTIFPNTYTTMRLEQRNVVLCVRSAMQSADVWTLLMYFYVCLVHDVYWVCMVVSVNTTTKAVKP